MPIVTGKRERWRVRAAHAGLILLIVVTLFPLAAVVSISLRPGNFATGSLIPERISFEHLANPEHEPSNLDSAQHVPVEHPAIAAEHLLFSDPAAALERFPHQLGEVGVVRHLRDSLS